MKKPEKVLDHRGDDRRRSGDLLGTATTALIGSSSAGDSETRRSADDGLTSDLAYANDARGEWFRAADQPRTDPAYEPVRAASRERQRTTPDFKRAMDASPAWVREAIRRHCESLRNEAAAYRVEAKTHRLRLEEITREHHTQDHDTSEVQP